MYLTNSKMRFWWNFRLEGEGNFLLCAELSLRPVVE